MAGWSNSMMTTVHEAPTAELRRRRMRTAGGGGGTFFTAVEFNQLADATLRGLLVYYEKARLLRLGCVTCQLPKSFPGTSWCGSWWRSTRSTCRNKAARDLGFKDWCKIWPKGPDLCCRSGLRGSYYEGSLKSTGCVSGICMPQPDTHRREQPNMARLAIRYAYGRRWRLRFHDHRRPHGEEETSSGPQGSHSSRA